jgi:very-short-patch-repair endonuclease
MWLLGALPTHVGGQGAKSDADAVIARLAARQHGVVSMAQLDVAGIHERGRLRRVESGRLHRVHREVFAVGHRGLSKAGRWMAAVLACGEGAVLSHASAGELWGMLRSRRPPSPAGFDADTHVTVPTEARRRRPGIVIHRSRTLDPSQVTRRNAIPVTTPSRTLADLRRTLPQPQFAAALRQAEYLGLPIGPGLEPDHTRSELEARFLAICRRHRLPKPEVNARAGPFSVDFLWPAAGLIAELDGYEPHGGRAAFEADRTRDTKLKLLGFTVVRFTWRQLTDGRADVAATLRTLLEARQ